MTKDVLWQLPVLVAHPDPAARRSIVGILAGMDVEAGEVETARDALAALDADRPFVAIVAAATLPDMDAPAFVEAVQARAPDVDVVVVASEPSVERAVQSMKAGAADFLVEPIDPEALRFVVSKAEARAARSDDRPPELPTGHGALLGQSPAMAEVRRLIARAAPGTATVLLRGESGTGKELAAREIHAGSARADRPFVKLHCAALPDALLESELFGYERGAFTGATARKPGRIELANKGTLFLDEIGDITPATQVKLLRVLQERELERLGGTETLKVDVRFVAATHRPLEDMVARGEFREDLFYRLNVVPIWLPPLRSRRDDIELLAKHFCSELGRAHGRPSLAFDEEALRLIRRERWPGNVRQLQNFVERLVVLASASTIAARDVQEHLDARGDFVTQAPSLRSGAEVATTSGELESARDRAERDALKTALERANGNRTVAARLLGVSRRTLYNKLQAHGLE